MPKMNTMLKVYEISIKINFKKKKIELKERK